MIVEISDLHIFIGNCVLMQLMRSVLKRVRLKKDAHRYRNENRAFRPGSFNGGIICNTRTEPFLLKH